MLSKIKNITLIVGLSVATTTFAAPPDHAPAHGWRKKNNQEHNFKGKTKGWDNDYGVSSGVCKTESVAKVLGASAGALIGGSLARDSNTVTQVIAVLGGAAIGSVLGEEIAKTFNLTDAACFGQAMELTPNGQTVVWNQNDIKYSIRPISNVSYQNMACRRVEIMTESGKKGKSKPQTAIACPNGLGQWSLN